MNEYGMKRTIAAVWGVAGVIILFSPPSSVWFGPQQTLLMLSSIGITGSSWCWSWLSWFTWKATVPSKRDFHRGLQQERVISGRTIHLCTHYLRRSSAWPIFMHRKEESSVSGSSVTAGIIVLVLLMRFLPQPWRGIIDAGVVMGLSWGLVALLVFSIQALTLDTFDHSPDVPEQTLS